MSCSVIKVQSSVPKRLSCQIIKVHSAAAFLEDRTCKIQVTDRNQCKMIFHDLWNFSKSICSGDISRSFVESCSCIRHQETSLMKLYIGLRWRRIVYDRTVLPECRDRSEAWTDKSTHLSTELIQFVRSAHLCDRLFANIFFQPFHKSDMSHAILDLSDTDIFDLCRILYTFE